MFTISSTDYGDEEDGKSGKEEVNLKQEAPVKFTIIWVDEHFAHAPLIV